ncbi:hypothetical protein IJJ27_01380 [bacterium]|nr:hypothetical protein [bacterium]
MDTYWSKRKNDRPNPPFEGINYIDRIESGITNIIIDNIYPYVEVTSKTIASDDGQRVFVVVYVPESHKAPHWINSRRDLFIRANTRTKTGRDDIKNKKADLDIYATSENWEFLRNKRKRSQQLAIELETTLNRLFLSYKDKEERLWNQNNEKVKNNPLLQSVISGDMDTLDCADPSITTIKNRQEFRSECYRDNISIIVQPVFPSCAISSPHDLREHYSSNSGANLTNVGSLDENYKLDYFQNGIVTFFTPDHKTGDHYTFFAQDVFGSCMVKHKIIQRAQKKIDNYQGYQILRNSNIIHVESLITYIEQFLRYTSVFYTQIGYLGELRLKVTMGLPEWSFLLIKDPNVNLPLAFSNPDKYYLWEKVFINADFVNNQKRNEIINSVYDSIGFFFNCDNIPKQIISDVRNSII